MESVSPPVRLPTLRLHRNRRTETIVPGEPPVIPPVAEANGPYTAADGSSVTFSRNGSTAPNASEATWTMSDGAVLGPYPNAAGAPPTGGDVSHQFPGPGDWTATVEILDTVTGLKRQDTAQVTITPVGSNPLAGLVLCPPGPLVLAPGETGVLTPSAFDAGGAGIVLPTLTWDNDNPVAAGLSGTGAGRTLVGVAPGSGKILVYGGLPRVDSNKVPYTVTSLIPDQGVLELPGMTRVFSCGFAAAPEFGVTNAELWKVLTAYGLVKTDATVFSMIDDAAAPVSPPKVWQARWPAYPNGPSGYTTVGQYKYMGIIPPHQGWLWQRMRLKVSANWSDKGYDKDTGAPVQNSNPKWFWNKKVGSTINHGWAFSAYNNPRIYVFPQGPGTDDDWWSPIISPGYGNYWEVELLYGPNTVSPTALADGTLQGMLNGAPIVWQHRSGVKPDAVVVKDLMWFPTGDAPTWDSLYFDLLFGGGSGEPQQTQYTWVDQFDLSVM